MACTITTKSRRTLHLGRVRSGSWLTLRPSQTTRLVAVRVEERCQCDNHVGRDEQCTFQVIAATVQDEEVDHEGGDEETDGLEQGEV